MSSGRPPSNTRDVRGGLLEAAWSLLFEAEEASQVSVSMIVERAGCTPPALYHHFGSKEGLLRAACIDELEGLAKRIDVVAADVRDSIDALVTRATTYFDFAVLSPAAYRVLFMGSPDSPSSADATEPGTGLRDLVAAVELCLPENRRAEAFDVSFSLWGVMHGLSAVHVSNPVIPTNYIREVLIRSVRSLAAGFELG